jgi:hypothetical protein
MQNKIIIPTIIAFAIILTGIVALAQYNSNKVVSNLNSSSSSSSSNVSSGSSLAMSSVVTVNSIISSSVFEKSSEGSEITQLPTESPEQPIVQLDYSNPPKYIKDYLDCKTKNLPDHYDRFIVNNGEYTYKCPPTLMENSCKISIFYNGENSNYKTKDGWLCDVGMGLPLECDIQINNIFESESDNQLIYSFKSKYQKARSVGDSCLIFTNSTMSNMELSEIKTKLSINKIIIYKQQP